MSFSIFVFYLYLWFMILKLIFDLAVSFCEIVTFHIPSSKRYTGSPKISLRLWCEKARISSLSYTVVSPAMHIYLITLCLPLVICTIHHCNRV